MRTNSVTGMGRRRRAHCWNGVALAALTGRLALVASGLQGGVLVLPCASTLPPFTLVFTFITGLLAVG